MERQDVVLARIKYLRQIKKYREEGRPIIYTDETYIHTSHASQKAWQSNGTSVNVPISKGERCIIVDAGSEEGFVKGARLIYDGKSTTGDYHGEMNSEKFVCWLRGQLIPNLPPKSVVVIDNASYHSVQEDKCPTQSTRKADIQAWLTRNNVAWSNDMLKVELLELCKTHRPLPTYVVDESLKQHGHTAIRLPPYHAELNSIELIWAMLKGKVARSNLTFKKKDVKKLTEDAFESISPKDWASCCRHVKDVEKRFYSTDIAVDDQVDRLVTSSTFLVNADA